MSIVDVMMDAAIRTMSAEGEWRSAIRAALRAIKPWDISEAMCDAACDALHGLPPDVVAEVRQRFSSMFVSAAIAAGAEQ